jgi:hypothetical protein
MGLAGTGEVRAALDACHAAAVRLSPAAVWGDCSNKLAWIVPILAEAFPAARIAHVVRDGRKVASSYFHKLADECYDDAAVAALAAYVAGAPAPPPEKRFWWPLPPPGHPLHQRFATFDRFQRIAFHWAESNRQIDLAARALPAGTVARFALEDLVADEARLRAFFAFLDLPWDPTHFAALRRPHNVNRPEDHPLTDVQRLQFDDIAGTMMDRMGYGGRPEYRMDYDPRRAAS